jgi:predicted regulator of Ras-like GTPase activity (Roadblock/LC7/MglB family)
MSTETRTLLRPLRRAPKEDTTIDYSEPDSGSWAARLDEFTHVSNEAEPAKPAAKAAAKPEVAAVAAPKVETVVKSSGLQDVLEKLLGFDGAMSVALVDSESGMILGQAGSGIDMELAAASASVTLRARLATIKALGVAEKIDDLLISLTSQVQIIHPLPDNPKIFTYLIGDKSKSSLAMARYKASEADTQIHL